MGGIGSSFHRLTGSMVTPAAETRRCVSFSVRTDGSGMLALRFIRHRLHPHSSTHPSGGMRNIFFGSFIFASRRSVRFKGEIGINAAVHEIAHHTLTLPPLPAVSLSQASLSAASLTLAGISMFFARRANIF
jgi:hypothetical protein